VLKSHQLLFIHKKASVHPQKKRLRIGPPQTRELTRDSGEWRYATVYLNLFQTIRGVFPDRLDFHDVNYVSYSGNDVRLAAKQTFTRHKFKNINEIVLIDLTLCALQFL
jgi:hypothetical protein